MQIELVKRHEAKITIACMTLLAMAAAYVLLTRPYHRIEGDFLEREDRRVVDEWLLSQFEVSIAEQRARACLALGRIGDHATLDQLIASLKDPATSVRVAAAFAIGVMEDEQTLGAQGLPPNRKAADALLTVLQDDERAVVANAVEALGKLGFPDVAERLTSTSAPYPITLPALARLQATELTQWIAERLKSDDQDNRWAAALALNALQAVSDEGITRSFLNLTRDRDGGVRAEVVTGLSRAKPAPEVFEALVKMSADRDPKVRIAAFGSLGKLRYPGTLELVEKFLRDRTESNENVVAAAIDALANLGDAKAILVLASLPIRTSVSTYRAQRALAILSGDDASWIQRLRPLPDNLRTPGAIRGIADALAESPAPQALEFLHELWTGQTPELQAQRPAVLTALGKRQAPNLDTLLKEALSSPDAALQMAALDTAANHRHPAQFGPLFMEALNAQNRNIRMQAARYLRWISRSNHDDRVGPFETRYQAQDYQRIARTVGHRIRMETSDGTMDIALDYRNAALTAEDFLELVRSNAYTGRYFEEVLPLNTLMTTARGETKPLRTEPNNQYFLRGSLGTSFANPAGQFFIALSPLPFYDARFTNFGRLMSGDGLLDRLTVETKILSMTVIE